MPKTKDKLNDAITNLSWAIISTSSTAKPKQRLDEFIAIITKLKTEVSVSDEHKIKTDRIITKLKQHIQDNASRVEKKHHNSLLRGIQSIPNFYDKAPKATVAFLKNNNDPKEIEPVMLPPLKKTYLTRG